MKFIVCNWKMPDGIFCIVFKSQFWPFDQSSPRLRKCPACHKAQILTQYFNICAAVLVGVLSSQLIVFQFLHAPILERRRWFNFKNCLAPPERTVELTGQSPGSPGIHYSHCVASYFQRISCPTDVGDWESFHTQQ